MTIITDYTTSTTGPSHIYADGTSGSDSNHGLTAGSPVLTLQKAFDLLPSDILNPVCVHLTGTFHDEGSVYLFKSVRGVELSYGAILIDGGDGETTVAGPFTADATGTTDYAQVSGAGWTPDEYAGYWVVFTSGDRAGDRRVIQTNTATQVYFTAFVGGAPDGCDFNIVRPTTTLSGTTRINMYGSGDWGRTIFQRLYVDSSSYFISSWHTFNPIRVEWCIVKCSGSDALMLNAGSTLEAIGHFTDPFTFVRNTTRTIGLSVLDSRVTVRGCQKATFDASYIYDLAVYNSYAMREYGAMAEKGTRIKRLRLDNCRSSDDIDTRFTFKNTSNYAKTTIGGGLLDVGMKLRNSEVILDAVEFRDCTNAIEANDSYVKFTAAATGTNNTGFDLVGTNNSIVEIAGGSPPNLAGASGDISTDGTTEDATWAEVDAAIDLHVAGELKVKEV